MLESRDDKGLSAEVANSHGRGVGFVESAFGVGVEDGLGEDACSLDCEEGDVQFFAVVGGSHGVLVTSGEVGGQETQTGEDGGQEAGSQDQE